MMSSILKNNSGFSLIEILVAIVLFGITAIAIVTMVTNAADTSANEAALSAQNNKVRSAVALIQREIGDANEILSVPGVRAAGDQDEEKYKKDNAFMSNEIIFSRIDNLSNGARRYTVERIKYNPPTDLNVGNSSVDKTINPDFSNTITIQSWTNTLNQSQQSDTYKAAGLGAIRNVQPKVLLDKVPVLRNNPQYGDNQPKTQHTSLFAYASSPTTYLPVGDNLEGGAIDMAQLPTWQNKVRLVDVNLFRDEDIINEANLAKVKEGTRAEKFPTAKLQTSIKVDKIGLLTPKSNRSPMC